MTVLQVRLIKLYLTSWWRSVRLHCSQAFNFFCRLAVLQHTVKILGPIIS